MAAVDQCRHLAPSAQIPFGQRHLALLAGVCTPATSSRCVMTTVHGAGRSSVPGMMTHTLPSPPVEPITCQPWCQCSDEHRSGLLRADRCCTGAEHRVNLSSEPTMLMGDGSSEQQYLNTYLLRQADESAPRVFIGYNDGSGRPATLDEARRFAFEILARVDEHEA